MNASHEDLLDKVCPKCGESKDLALCVIHMVFGRMNAGGDFTEDPGNDSWLYSIPHEAECACGWTGDTKDLSSAEAA